MLPPETPQIQESKKPPYPKSVFFIIGNEFCERFCYYGLRTLLFLYLKNVLLFTPDDATAINHGFMFLSYFFPLMGAILADSFLGKYRTIVYLSLVYSLGCITLSLGSINYYGIPARGLSLIGLVLIAIGTGGIKPCVSAFGGDQFTLPQQQSQLETFFSVFYFSINLGSVISTYLTPVLKKDISCFESNTCYPLAFGIPSALMIISTVIFVGGRPFYMIKKPGRNIILEVIYCIKHAIGSRLSFKGRTQEKMSHWLDYARDEYDETLISDVKSLMAVLHMFLPVPLFWALFDQQTSRWIAQAESMNGQIWSWTIQPEQMQALNPLFILLFIPMFNFLVYPVLSSMSLLTKPLQRLGAGGFLAAVAFIASALIEFRVETTYASLPKTSQGQLRIFNGLDCPIFISSNVTKDKYIGSQRSEYFLDIKVSGDFTSPLFIASNCSGSSMEIIRNVTIYEKQSKSYLITKNGSSLNLLPIPGFDRIEKSLDQIPILRLIHNGQQNISIYFDGKSKMSETYNLEMENISLTITDIAQDSYFLKINGKMLREKKLMVLNGGVYTVMVTEGRDGMDASFFEITPGNTIHILWQLPQIVIITIAEVMFSITGLHFAFTQAPLSMKSVVASLWLLTTALGNVIVAVVAESHLFSSKAYELLLFAALMVVDMFIFMLLASRYKYKTFNEK